MPTVTIVEILLLVTTDKTSLICNWAQNHNIALANKYHNHHLIFTVLSNITQSREKSTPFKILLSYAQMSGLDEYLINVKLE